MKHRRASGHGSYRTCFPLLLLLSVLLLIPGTAVYAASNAVKISGTVYASRLPANAEVTLTGNTSIVVDQNKTIKYITGKQYSLSVTKTSSAGKTLTVNPNGEHITAVDVKSFTTNASVTILEGFWGGLIGNDFVNIQQGAVVRVEKGSIHGNTVYLNGTVNVSKSACAVACGVLSVTTGNVTLEYTASNPYANIVQASNAILIYGGTINSKGQGGIYAKNSITINGGTVNSQSLRSGWKAFHAANGSIYVYGGKVTARGSYGFSSDKGIEVASGAVVEAYGSTRGMDTAGYVKLYGKVTAQGGSSDGIYAKGNITVYSGSLDARGKKNGLWTKSGTISIKSPLSILTPAGGGIAAHNIVTVSGGSANAVVIKSVAKIPGLITLPSSQTWYVDDTLRPSVSSGVPSGKTKHWKWQRCIEKDGAYKDITGATGETYKIKNGDIGYYIRAVLSVDDYTGELKSNAVLAHSKHAVVTAQPMEKTTTVGKPFTFTVKANNASSYSWNIRTGSGSVYSWSTIQKHAIVGSTTGSSVTITPKDTFLNGLYIYCSIKGLDGTTTKSNMARMRVNDCIYEQPQNGTAYIGGNLAFRTSCTGADTYHWDVYQSESSISSIAWSQVRYHAIADEITKTTIVMVPKDDWLDGKYIQCSIILTSGITVKTKRAKISVTDPISTQPTAASVQVGKSVTFSTYAVGASAYSWRVYPAGKSYGYTSLKDTSHAVVTGAENRTVKLTPTDTWLNGMEIACCITLSHQITIETKHVKLTVTPAPTPSVTPTPTPSVTPTPTPSPKPEAVGTVFTGSDGAKYRVTNATPGKAAAAYKAAPASVSGKATVPASVTYSGIEYKIQNIDANAFKGKTDITQASIGKYVRTIGNNAFQGCTKLKKVTGGGNVRSIGKFAFKQCPELTEITVGAKVEKIGAYAFMSCKKLKTLTVKTTKLTGETVGTKAFTGTPSTLVVKVPAEKLEEYRTLFIARAINKKAVFQALS